MTITGDSFCECKHPLKYHDVKEIRAVKGINSGKHGVCGMCSGEKMFHSFKPEKKEQKKGDEKGAVE